MLSYKRTVVYLFRGLPGGSVVKTPLANAGDKRCRFDPWIRKTPWRRKWSPTPVFLPEKFHGQGNLLGYSPWGHKESDMTNTL